MQKPLLSWIDEQAGINAFLTGEVASLPLGNPIGVTTDSLRAQQDSLLMGLALLAREATVLGLQTEVAHDYCCQYLPIIETTTERTLPQVAHDLAWGLRRQVIAVRAGRYSLHVTQALRFVDQHIEARLTVKMISEYTGISERHLGQLFKQEVGTTLSAYIAAKKLTPPSGCYAMVMRQWQKLQTHSDMRIRHTFVQASEKQHKYRQNNIKCNIKTHQLYRLVGFA